jgi:hypothetical protein
MPASQSGSGKSAACEETPAKKQVEKKATSEKRMEEILFRFILGSLYTLFTLNSK